MEGDSKLLNINGSTNKLVSEEVFDAILNKVKQSSDLNYRVSAPGKLILFGEHSVVYGKSALAASINKRTYLSVAKNNLDDIFAISMRPLNFFYVFAYENLIRLVNDDIPGADGNSLGKPINNPNYIHHEKYFELLKKNFNDNLCVDSLPVAKEVMESLYVFLYLFHGIFYKNDYIPPLVIDICTELTLGAGTGSSASYCVSIAAALLYYRNIEEFGLSSAREVTFSKKVRIYYVQFRFY